MFKILGIMFFLALSNQHIFAQSQEIVATDPKPSLLSKVVDNLSIGYFSEILGPSLSSLSESKYPDVDSKGNFSEGSEPIQAWNQISFGYKINSVWKAIFNPRFTLHLGTRKDIPADDGVMRTEDFLVGAQGTIWKSGDWSLWVRPAYRLPTSRATIDANWNGQVEWLHIIDKAPNSSTAWGVGMWHMVRAYVPSEASVNERWRMYMAPYVNYTFNDKFRYDFYYENEIQHNEPFGEKDYLFSKRSLQSAFTGINWNINKSFSVFPFLRFYSVRKIQQETMGVGTWISASLF
ncbi:MAG: hypothetical protein K2P81_00135 [Bacteriovoracaceae bacterium]|nr:hypothetical protein [Bacteriovoracaceae bacterium]